MPQCLHIRVFGGFILIFFFRSSLATKIYSQILLGPYICVSFNTRTTRPNINIGMRYLAEYFGGIYAFLVFIHV